MRSRESGMILIPIVCLLAISVSAAFLLIPALDREDLLEAQRLRLEQARAAAEAACALALHRDEDVEGLQVGLATAAARLARHADEVIVRAEAHVPSLRGATVRFSFTARYRLSASGYTLLDYGT